MSDLADAVHQAFFASLQAAVTRATVYTIVPDKTLPPVVVIAESSAEQVGGKNSDAERHDVAVRSILAGTSKRELHLLMEQVKGALHNRQLTLAGFWLSRVVMTSSDDSRDVDEGAVIGTQNFTVFVQRA